MVVTHPLDVVINATLLSQIVSWLPYPLVWLGALAIAWLITMGISMLSMAELLDFLSIHVTTTLLVISQLELAELMMLITSVMVVSLPFPSRPTPWVMSFASTTWLTTLVYTIDEPILLWLFSSCVVAIMVANRSCPSWIDPLPVVIAALADELARQKYTIAQANVIYGIVRTVFDFVSLITGSGMYDWMVRQLAAY